MRRRDKGRPGGNVRQIADDVAANIADLLRIRSISKELSPVYHDGRLMTWLASESRAVVRDGLESDPWQSGEVLELANRIRSEAASNRTSVRRLSGRPTCLAPPSIENPLDHAAVTRQGASLPWVQLATAAGSGRELWDEECDTWVALPDGLPGGSYVALNVKGESMQPLLHDGDVVLVNMGASPSRGDIVLARTENGYVVKRLARISRTGVILESLNPQFEPITVRDFSRSVAGVVVLRWCDHDMHQLRLRQQDLSSPS